MTDQRLASLQYLKTDAGQQAFKERSASISARQRSAFLLFDGKRSLPDVLAATAGLGITADDITDLLNKGFLAPPLAPTASSLAAAASADAPGSADPADERTPTERYKAAYPIATRLTAKLGLRGFQLNLAVEGASGYDDLVAMLPKLTDALGASTVKELRQALGVR